MFLKLDNVIFPSGKSPVTNGAHANKVLSLRELRYLPVQAV